MTKRVRDSPSHVDSELVELDQWYRSRSDHKPRRRKTSSPAALSYDEPVCSNCGADSQDLVSDEAAGDVVCRGCGLVVCERVVSLTSFESTHEDDFGRRDLSRHRFTVVDVRSDAGGVGGGTDISRGGGAGRGGTSRDALATAHRRLKHSSKSAEQTAQERVGVLVRRLGAALCVPERVLSCAEELSRRFHIARAGVAGAHQRRRYTRALEALAAALLFRACREQGSPCTFKQLDVVSSPSCSEKQIRKSFRTVQSILPSKATPAAAQDGAMATHVGNIVETISARLRLDFDVVKRCRTFVVHALGVLEGRNPNTVAAAVVAIITHAYCPSPPTPKRIALYASVYVKQLQLAVDALHASGMGHMHLNSEAQHTSKAIAPTPKTPPPPPPPHDEQSNTTKHSHNHATSPNV